MIWLKEEVWDITRRQWQMCKEEHGVTKFYGEYSANQWGGGKSYGQVVSTRGNNLKFFSFLHICTTQQSWPKLHALHSSVWALNVDGLEVLEGRHEDAQSILTTNFTMSENYCLLNKWKIFRNDELLWAKFVRSSE